MENPTTSNQEKSLADLFAGLPHRRFAPRQSILYQGDKITHVYYILAGYVKMYTITPKGNERTLLIIGPGDTLPLIQTPTAQYFYAAFTEVLAAYGTYDEVVDRFLADRDYMDVARESGVVLMNRLMKRMEIVASDSASEKIEEILKYLGTYFGVPEGKYRRIKFKLTHQEIANMVNVARETVSQNMVRLERNKSIKPTKDGFILVKTES